MRKRQKIQFMELLDTLCKACKQLMTLPYGGVRVNLCADIQEFVAGMFEFLQKQQM